MAKDLKHLVRKIREGDSVAYETLFKRYAERLYYFSMRYLGNEAEAEEITQDVFIKLWLKREDLRDDLSINSFLFLITKNAVIDVLRKRQKDRKGQQDYSDEQRLIIETPDDIFEYQELSREVNQLVDSLPERRRLIYKLSREQGLSYKEIARKLNISPKTVEVQIGLSLKQIKSFLKKRMPSISIGGAIFLHFFL